MLTNDVLSDRMAGPAIRAWHIATALAATHDVHLATLAETCTVTPEGFRVSSVTREGIAALEAESDVVIVQGYSFDQAAALRNTQKVLVFDLYDPLHIEALEQTKALSARLRGVRVQGAIRVLNEQLSCGDFFLCASEKQRDLWIGQLGGVGRINEATYDYDPTLRKLIDTVPFGMPDEDPVHRRNVLRGVVPGIAEDDELLIWAGGIYDWFDPLTLIRAVARLAERRPRLRLYFMGLKHPNPEVPPMPMAVEAQRLASELGVLDKSVFFNPGWVPYGDRQDYLLEADIGVSTHFEHAETAYSFRTRILDYLWAGLPIVSTGGDSFANLVALHGLGAVVGPEDVAGLASAIDGLLSDSAHRRDVRSRVAEERLTFRWGETLRPLIEFCADPRRAPDPGPNRARQRRRGTTMRNLAPLPSWLAADAMSVAHRVKRRVERRREAG